MDRYPSPFDPTRDSGSRRFAELIAAAGLSGVVTLALASGSVKPISWWITGVPTAVALAFIARDEIRLRRLLAGAWTTDEWDLLRENEYRRRQGVFLTHTAAPAASRRDDGRTNWTVALQLAQHKTGPLSDGEIKHVEYAFGPKFTEGLAIVRSSQDNFRYATDLYAPLLVLGRVVFKNRFKRPLIVERYVDLPRQ